MIVVRPRGLIGEKAMVHDILMRNEWNSVELRAYEKIAARRTASGGIQPLDRRKRCRSRVGDEQESGGCCELICGTVRRFPPSSIHPVNGGVRIVDSDIPSRLRKYLPPFLHFRRQ